MRARLVRLRRCIIVMLLATALVGLQVFPANAADSNSDWATALPEEVGLDSAALVEMLDFVGAHEVPVHSVQIARHGRLVLDAYFYPFSPEMRHDVASVTKSVTSTLIGLAIQKGILGNVQQPVLELFENPPAENLDARKRRITIENLLTMQAGWDCGFEPHEARLYEMRRSSDWLQFMLDLPMVADPGTRFAYCSGNPHLLSIILSQKNGANALAFARKELFEPLGIKDIFWPADPKGNSYGWGDLQLRPRDMAKLGQLFLQRGRWGDSQLLAESWIETATRRHVEHTVNKDHYGYAWWVKDNDYPGMFEAVGRGGQRITVWPAKDLVVVFTGGGFEPGDLGKFIGQALKSERSLPANPEAVAKLRERAVSALKPPRAQPVRRFPATAARISGHVIRLSANSMGIQELALKFDDSAEATGELVIDGRHERFAVGLDGIERLASRELNNHLRPASKGQWLDENTFMLQLDLVGGINCYTMKLSFGQEGKVDVGLSERTGLTEERLRGK